MAEKMSEAHKAALAEGRKQAANVKPYLDAIRTANAPKKKGRRRSPDRIKERLGEIENELDNDPTPLAELQLRQERLDLAAELEALEAAEESDPAKYEAKFVESAAAYSDAKGITYAAWREMGVPAGVLKRAGVSR